MPLWRLSLGICNEYLSILGAAGTFIPWPGLEGKLGLGLGALFRARSAAHPLLVSPQGAKYRGSVCDFPDFNPSQDAETLYNAMKGFGGCSATAGKGACREGSRTHLGLGVSPLLVIQSFFCLSLSFFFFLATIHGMRDLSSPTSD